MTIGDPTPALGDEVDAATMPGIQAPAASVAHRKRELILNIGRYTLLAIVIAVAVIYLWGNWAEVEKSLRTLSVGTLLFSFGALVLSIGCATMSWQVLVDDLGKPIGPGRGAQIFLVGQLGKYVPGAVWAYVLQLELGRKAGLARARVFAATVFSVAVAAVAALLAGAFAVPEIVQHDPDKSWLYWLYLAIPVALVCLHPKVLTAAVRLAFRLLRRPRPDHPVSYRTVGLSLTWAFASYILSGTHLWLLVRQSIDLGVQGWVMCIGTMGAAMLAGLFIFFLPSGVGAREWVILAVLSPLIGQPAAVAFAAVSRLLYTVADLTTAGAAALVAVAAKRKLGHYHGDPGID